MHERGGSDEAMVQDQWISPPLSRCGRDHLCRIARSGIKLALCRRELPYRVHFIAQPGLQPSFGRRLGERVVGETFQSLHVIGKALKGTDPIRDAQRKRHHSERRVREAACREHAAARDK